MGFTVFCTYHMLSSKNMNKNLEIANINTTTTFQKEVLEQRKNEGSFQFRGKSEHRVPMQQEVRTYKNQDLITIQTQGFDPTLREVCGMNSGFC
jgi:hypothetical protein